MFPIPSPCFNASLFWWWRVGLHQSDWCACDRLRFWRGSKNCSIQSSQVASGVTLGPWCLPMKFRVIADAEFGDSSWAIFGDGISTLRDDFFSLIRFSWMTTWMQSRVQLATKVIPFIVWQMGFKAQFKTPSQKWTRANMFGNWVGCFWLDGKSLCGFLIGDPLVQWISGQNHE